MDAVKRIRGGNRLKPKDKLSFCLYLLPSVALYAVFKYWPIIYSFFLSFYKWNFVGKMKWVGLQNYVNMFDRAAFQMAVGNTGLYILGMFPFFVVLPLLMALMVMGVRNKKLQTLNKVCFFLPYILAFSIICLVWMWMFNPGFGLLNNLLKLFGLEGYSWLSDTRTAMFSVILVSGWKQMGANMILFIAGLLCVSEEYVEAAKIDGANKWQLFWRIKWPLLAPTTAYMVLTSVIFAAERAFTPINILTRGGPSDTTTNLSHLIYQFGFQYFNIGMSSAIAIFTALAFFIVTLVMMKVSGGYQYDEK
ncbi:MAG: sugar ABC transporter permease [Clostridia bacterium]